MILISVQPESRRTDSRIRLTMINEDLREIDRRVVERQGLILTDAIVAWATSRGLETFAVVVLTIEGLAVDPMHAVYEGGFWQVGNQRFHHELFHLTLERRGD